MSDDRRWNTGARRDSNVGKNRPDLIPPECLWRLGWLYAKGCEHYGEHNWEKGIPTDSFIESFDRHWLKYKLGWDDEDHLASAVFNLFGIMFNEIHGQEAQNKPVTDEKYEGNYIDPAWRFDAK